MIRIEGGFWLQLDIGSKKDFISSPDDLLEFTVVESCGGNLPEFILAFVTKDETILALIHEGTPIKATYGRDSKGLGNVVCFSGKFQTQKEGENDRSIAINGLCVDQNYITDNTLAIYEKKSGVETAIAVLKKRFKVVSNVEKSADSQVWIQPSITDKNFVSKVLLHSDLPNSFPVFAITSDGKFILKDAVKAIRDEKPKWRFVSQVLGATDIEVLADGATEFNSTFINNWTGYSRITKVLDTVKSTMKDVSTAFKPLLSMSSIAEALKDVKYRYKGFKAQSDAVHANYWASADRNLVFITQMSKVDVTHSFVDVYHDVKPLDLVFIKEFGKDSKTSSDYTSGLYFVSSVSRSIQGKKFITTVGFNRESMNNLKNVGG